MGDMGDLFNAHRQEGKERRERNRETTPLVLERHGLAYEEKNFGAHLIVRHAGKVADLWPGTGKYSVRGSNRYKRGVFSLLRDLGVKPQAASHGSDSGVSDAG